MTAPASSADYTPIYEGFRKDYFLVWLEDYGLFCIPNFVARLQDGKLVLMLLEHVTEVDITNMRDRLGDAAYTIASERLTFAQIEREGGFKIPG